MNSYFDTLKSLFDIIIKHSVMFTKVGIALSAFSLLCTFEKVKKDLVPL